MENKKDYIVRGTAANGQIRCFAITSRNLVEEARSPVIKQALSLPRHLADYYPVVL